MEKARQPWMIIMTEQINAAPWIEIQGVKHAVQCSKLWDSFMECIRFHLLTNFWNDAAETKMYYISNCLKKPNQVPIWQFVQKVQQINGYLDLPPCLFYSPQATKLTKRLGPFANQDLASHILCTYPGTWQAQYHLTEDTLPQSVCKILVPTKEEKAAKNGKPNPSNCLFLGVYS